MRIFVTHIAPREFGQRNGISVAATNFSYNLAESGIFDKVYSILPPFVKTDYCECLKHDIVNFEYSRLRNTPLYRFAALKEQYDLFLKIPDGANVWLYNMTPLNAYIVRLLRLFKPSVNIFVIVLDFTPGDSKSEKWLPLINSLDGRICLSTSDRFKRENSVCLPGVVPDKESDYPMVRSITPDFLISGILDDKISMLSTLLNVFSNMPHARLHITGNAPELALEYSRKYDNIIYHGLLSYDCFIELLHDIPFLLSTRDPRFEENQCNFPSKIIEGLLHNRIIISTIDYPQLGNIKYLKIDSENISEGIRSILSMPEQSVLTYANQSEATRISFGIPIWEKWMTEIEQANHQ